jgi:excisionase family DNA binding protein
MSQRRATDRARTIAARLEYIEHLVLQLRTEVHALAAGRDRDPLELLTKAAARRLLHCDKPTLDAMLRSGRLRGAPAPSGKGVRIPRAELERLTRPPPPPEPPRRPPRRPSRGAASGPGIAIRAIPVPRGDE